MPATAYAPLSSLPFALAAFAIGAVLLQWQPALPATEPWLGGAALVGAVGMALHTTGRRVVGARFAAVVLGVLAAGALGFGYAAWRADIRLADSLPSEWEGVDIAIVGVVDDLPQPSERGTRFAFSIERIESAGAIVPGRLSLAWYAQMQKGGATEPAPPIEAGERWRLVVRLKRPHGTVNPHGFDVEAWMLESGLRATGSVRSSDRNARIDAFAGRASDYIQRARENVRARILAALPEARYAGVVVALTIGEQRAVPESQWRVFNRTGISHLISISGLHVTVFATLAGGLAYALARRSVALTTRIPARSIAAGIGVAFAIAYVLLAGAQVPAVRTLLMLMVAAVGLVVARPGSASVVWLWALVVVLAWDPWAGLTPGFWLSFGAVGALLYAGVGRLSSPAPPSFATRMARMFKAATRTQAVVTMALVPGTLALFQQVSLVSPLANALAIPVVTFAVVPLALCAIVVPIDALWWVAHAAFAALMIPLDVLAALPAAAWQQHAPPGWAVAVSLAGVALLVAPRGVPGRSLGFIAMLPLFVIRPPPPAEGAFRMTVLDVGQGLAVVVETHRHALLYDTGPRYSEEADAGGRIVAPFLRATGIGRLSGMIVTHQDADHSGGALTLLQTVPLEWLASSLPADHAIVLRHTADGGNSVRCVAGQQWTWDEVRFEVLQPAARHYDMARLKPNDLSCVVRIGSSHGSVLLTGDLEARGELELVANDPALLKSDVLVVPHHGSRTSSTAAFIAAVAPRIAVYTSGYRNRFGHPRPDVVARYEAAGIRGYRSDYDGALTFEFAADASREPRAERAHDLRYWRDAPKRDSPPLD
ncbi:MAG: DNA internalization-related competence protein ComEC/Rec2 [Betaproteobacteria bacterium]